MPCVRAVGHEMIKHLFKIMSTLMHCGAGAHPIALEMMDAMRDSKRCAQALHMRLQAMRCLMRMQVAARVSRNSAC